MKSENMLSGGSYVINPETEEVHKVESTLSAEEAAALEADAAEKAASNKRKLIREAINV